METMASALDKARYNAKVREMRYGNECPPQTDLDVFDFFRKQVNGDEEI